MVESKFNLGTTTPQASSAAVDEGLRSYMLRVYNYMAMGTAVTGITAWITANTALVDLFYIKGVGSTGLGFIVMFAPLIFVFALSFGIQRMKPSTAQLLFWAVTFVFGLSLANIFLTFTEASIARVFFITAGVFGAMSLWGYTTKRDLTKFGAFLFMGLIGVIIASVVNMFIGSAMIHWVVSVIGVLVFVGLTAWDTQRIKNTYDVVSHDSTLMTKTAVMGALSLYLNFINMFILLLLLFAMCQDFFLRY